MNIYYEPFGNIWICEAEVYGKKYIGEGRSFNEAQSHGWIWQSDVLSAIEEKQNDYRSEPSNIRGNNPEVD